MEPEMDKPPQSLVRELVAILSMLPENLLQQLKELLLSLDYSDIELLKTKDQCAHILSNAILPPRVEALAAEKLHSLIDFSSSRIEGNVTIGDIVLGNQFKVIFEMVASHPNARTARQFFASPPRIEPHFVVRKAELTRYRTFLERQGFVVITGQAGAGKSTLATMLCREFGHDRDVLYRKVEQSFDVGDFEEALRWHAGIFGDDAAQTDAAPTADPLFEALATTDYLLFLDNIDQFTANPVTSAEKLQAGQEARFLHLIERLVNSARTSNIRLIITTREVPRFLLGQSMPLESMGLAEASELLDRMDCPLSSELSRQLHTATSGLAQLLVIATSTLTATPEPKRRQWIERLVEAPNVTAFLNDAMYRRLQPAQRQLLHCVAIGEDMPTTALAAGYILELDRSAKPELDILVNKFLLSYQPGEQGSYSMSIFLWQYYNQLLASDPSGAFKNYHERSGNYFNNQDIQYYRALFHYSRAKAFDTCLDVALKSLLSEDQVLPSGPLFKLVYSWPDSSTKMLPLIQILYAEACFGHGDIETAYTLYSTLLEETILSSENSLCKVRALERLASIEIQLGRYSLADSYIKRGQTLLRSLQLPDLYKERANQWLVRRHGVITGHQGQRRKALIQHATAIETQRIQEVIDQEFGASLLTYATELAELGRDEVVKDASLPQIPYKAQAIAAFQEATSVFETIGFVRGVATSLVNLGNLYSNFQEYEAAEACYRRVSELISGEQYANDPKFTYLRAVLQNAQGASAYERNAFEQATHYMTRARELYDALGDMTHGLQGQVDSRYRLLDIAIDAFRTDSSQEQRARLAGAINEGQKALEIARKPDYPFPGLELCVLRALADALIAIDHGRGGESRLQEAWGLICSGTAEDPADLCLFFSARARFYLRQGHGAKALEDLQDGLIYAERTGFPFYINRLKQELKALKNSSEGS